MIRRVDILAVTLVVLGVSAFAVVCWLAYSVWVVALIHALFTTH